MNIKINFLKIRKEKKFKKKNFDINVNSHWKFLLFVSLLVIIFAFSFGFFVFREMNKEFVLLNIKNSGQMEKVKKERIEGILDYFLTKEQKTGVILSSESPIIDPSK